MFYKSIFQSPMGKIQIVSDEEQLLGVYLDGQCDHASIVEHSIDKETDVILQTKSWLSLYFQKQKPDIKELPLAPRGNAFRQCVWQILCEIPYGKTTTYKEVAKEVARRLHKENMSAQAIGNAVGHNPISIIIPCHRVVGTDGSLVGYGGGLDKKIMLLEIEGVDVQKLYLPKSLL